MYALIVKGFWWRKLKLNDMKYTVEQLHLLIHNCKIYGINPSKWIKMLNELENKNNKDEQQRNNECPRFW